MDSMMVVDAALSMNEVEELRVLSFYAKVFDISPEYAVLCVSPRLGARGKQLANEYNITILENEVPKLLVPMVAKHIEELLGQIKVKRRPSRNISR